MAAVGEAVVVVLQDGTKLSVSHIVVELYPDRIFDIVEECGWGWFALFDVCLMAGIRCLPYRHDSSRPRVSGVEFVFAHVGLGLIPDDVELGTFDNHCEILVLNG